MLHRGRLAVAEREDHIPALEVDVGTRVGGLEHQDPFGGAEVVSEVGVEGRKLNAAKRAADAHEDVIAVEAREHRQGAERFKTPFQPLAELRGALIPQFDPIAVCTAGAFVGEDPDVGFTAEHHRRRDLGHDPCRLPLTLVPPFHRHGVARGHPGRELDHPESRGRALVRLIVLGRPATPFDQGGAIELGDDVAGHEPGAGRGPARRHGAQGRTQGIVEARPHVDGHTDHRAATGLHTAGHRGGPEHRPGAGRLVDLGPLGREARAEQWRTGGGDRRAGGEGHEGMFEHQVSPGLRGPLGWRR